MIKRNKALFYLLMIYFIVVLIKVILSPLVPYPLYLSDERQYVEMSRSFLNQGNFFFEGNPSQQYPPLYPIFLLPTSFFEKIVAYPLIKIMNAFVTTSIIFPVYLISREFLKEKRAITIATLSLFIPESFVLSFTIMSENLFFPLFMFSIYFMLKSFSENNKKWDILCGLFIGLSILTRMIGLTLLVAIIPILLIKAFYIKKSFKEKIKVFFLNKLFLFLILFLIIIPWFVRNLYYFGFSVSGLFGEYGIGKTSGSILMNGELISNIITFFFINIAYIIFGSGILFFALTIFLTKNLQNYRSIKLFNLILITWVLFAVFILLCTYMSFTDLAARFTGSAVKIMGRYLASILPIFLITGGIGLNLYKNKFKELFIVLVFCSVVLAFLPTDKLIATFDTLSLHLLYLPQYFFGTYFITKIGLIILPIIIFIGRKYFLTWKYALIILFIFFITSSSIATIAIHIGSLDAKDYMEFAIWMNSNISKNSIIFVNKNKDNPNELFWAIESIKFWTDNKVIIGNINMLNKGDDYVISKSILDLPLIMKINTKEGIFNPKTEVFYFYKNLK